MSPGVEKRLAEPALMSGGGQRDDHGCGPGVGAEDDSHVRDEDERQNKDSHEEHGELAAGVDGVSVVHAPAESVPPKMEPTEEMT